MVVAIWSEDAYSQDMLNVFWEEVYDKLQDHQYGVDGIAYAVYRDCCREWAAADAYPASSSYLESEIDGQEYAADHSENQENCVERISFSFTHDGQLRMSLTKETSATVIRAGNTEACFGEAEQTFEIASFIRWKRLRENPIPYAAYYRWVSERALLVHIDWLHTAHSTEITCLFGNENVTAVFTPSYEKFLAGAKSTPALCIASQSFAGNKVRT